MQTKWVKTGNEGWLKLTKLFGKLFLINFAAGVVTGIVQEFQFGMNWSEYSRFVGDIFGAPLALEALIAFFLESTFVGLWIFGWNKLPKKLHLATIYLTAIGTTISSIFILAANSWMQNPVGAIFENGRAQLDDFLALITNPFFLTTLPHTLAASFIVAGGLVLGVSGYWLAKSHSAAKSYDTGEGEEGDDAQIGTDAVRTKTWHDATKFGAIVVVVAALAGIVTGDLMGKVEAEYQPAKLAASEGLYNSADTAEFSLIAWFDADGKPVFDLSVPIPGLLSWLAYGDTDAKVQGISDIREQFAANGYQTWDGEKWGAGNALQTGAQAAGIVDNANIDPIPNVTISYYAFRVMLAMGFLGLLIGLIVLVKTRGSNIPKQSKLWTALMIFIPLWPMLANIGGWVLAEIGRQPWIVYGVLATESAVSPNVSPFEVGFSLALYTLIYAVVAVLVVKLFLDQIRAGLPEVEDGVSDEDADRPLQFAY
jgi:cytochrome d ubiquinol oxidase subunit I